MKQRLIEGGGNRHRRHGHLSCHGRRHFGSHHVSGPPDGMQVGCDRPQKSCRQRPRTFSRVGSLLRLQGKGILRGIERGIASREISAAPVIPKGRKAVFVCLVQNVSKSLASRPPCFIISSSASYYDLQRSRKRWRHLHVLLREDGIQARTQAIMLRRFDGPRFHDAREALGALRRLPPAQHPQVRRSAPVTARWAQHARQSGVEVRVSL
eukprot:scaffold2808_cov255-Pinguiococcus_pyrenoidosus.AAC.27